MPIAARTAVKIAIALSLLVPGAAGASLTVIPGLTVQNRCGKSIVFVARYQDVRRNWTTLSEIGLNGGDTKQHVAGMSSPVLYYYAESMDGGKTRWAGDQNVRVDGKVYPMKRETLALNTALNSYRLTLTCR
ncbi:hypothetical protein [Caulobacter rhizosphaerae]|jgi:hypothetical protein|uniref:hypothetical protein n=1 Tax=Caulobacter rhizosphaerae TaxID=2010972 RepID=UPI0013D7CE22|nr:hypothetical protein [Caulobacter rhizosphaerae]GGL42709.1 hypothetical protein GCM10010983_44910 [Caulobacter rhizosphaerae]